MLMLSIIYLFLASNPHDIEWLARYGIKYLYSYPEEEKTKILDNFYKVAFVRHPLDRLLSAYLSKIEERENNENDHSGNYGPHLKARIISKARKEKNDTSSPVTFEEFLKFTVLDNLTPEDYVDIHWTKYNDACYFCKIDYDFIGSFDTLEQDVNYALRKMYRRQEDHWFPACNPGKKTTALKYYQNIPNELLDEVEKTYQIDFDLFGFEKGLYRNTG